jgi:hypothetical protein
VHSEAVKCAPPSRPGHHRRHPSADLAGAALTAGIPTQNLCEVNDSQTTNIANVAKSRTHKINELRTVFQIPEYRGTNQTSLVRVTRGG